MGLFEFYKTGELVDCEVIIDGSVYRCHKLVLASKSTYFKNYFTASDSSVCTLQFPCCCNDVFPHLLYYLYEGHFQCRVAIADTIPLLVISARLQMHPLTAVLQTSLQQALQESPKVAVAFLCIVHHNVLNFVSALQELTGISKRSVADNLHQLAEEIHCLQPDQLAEILEATKDDPQHHTPAATVSHTVTQYLQRRIATSEEQGSTPEQHLSQREFEALCSAIPDIHPDDVLVLLALSIRLKDKCMSQRCLKAANTMYDKLDWNTLTDWSNPLLHSTLPLHHQPHSNTREDPQPHKQHRSSDDEMEEVIADNDDQLPTKTETLLKTRRYSTSNKTTASTTKIKSFPSMATQVSQDEQNLTQQQHSSQVTGSVSHHPQTDNVQPEVKGHDDSEAPKDTVEQDQPTPLSFNLPRPEIVPSCSVAAVKEEVNTPLQEEEPIGTVVSCTINTNRTDTNPSQQHQGNTDHTGTHNTTTSPIPPNNGEEAPADQLHQQYQHKPHQPHSLVNSPVLFEAGETLSCPQQQQQQEQEPAASNNLQPPLHQEVASPNSATPPPLEEDDESQQHQQQQQQSPQHASQLDVSPSLGAPIVRSTVSDDIASSVSTVASEKDIHNNNNDDTRNTAADTPTGLQDCMMVDDNHSTGQQQTKDTINGYTNQPQTEHRHNSVTDVGSCTLITTNHTVDDQGTPHHKKRKLEDDTVLSQLRRQIDSEVLSWKASTCDDRVQVEQCIVTSLANIEDKLDVLQQHLSAVQKNTDLELDQMRAQTKGLSSQLSTIKDECKYIIVPKNIATLEAKQQQLLQQVEEHVETSLTKVQKALSQKTGSTLKRLSQLLQNEL